MDFKENVAPEGFTEPLRLTTKLNMRSTSISNFSSDIEAEKEYLIKLKTQRQKVKRFPYIDWETARWVHQAEEGEGLASRELRGSDGVFRIEDFGIGSRCFQEVRGKQGNFSIKSETPHRTWSDEPLKKLKPQQAQVLLRRNLPGTQKQYWHLDRKCRVQEQSPEQPQKGSFPQS